MAEELVTKSHRQMKEKEGRWIAAVKAFSLAAGVEASSTLRRAKNVYYPPAIRASSSLGSKADTTPQDPNPRQVSPAKAPSSSNNPPKEVKQVKVAEKKKDTTKGVAPETTKPPTAPKDPPEDKEVSQSLEIVLATLPIPTKEDSKGKGPVSTTAATDKPTKATEKTTLH